ncbi:MAG: hypothetical protein RBT11_07555 [Desulfobacterales bacterium]|jgi:hypothetical protein|nr:hypothetical protein [Desulfobacterales bacterium]
MDLITKKITHWIDEGKDPRIAHWQGGLERLQEVVSPYMKPGNLVPVQPLNAEDVTVFNAALAAVDLSPTLTAAFIPPAIAGQIVPPETIAELQRIERGKPAYKILIVRPGAEERMVCIELSEHAEKPGLDIFEAGVLLGSYDFTTQQDCLDNLTKTLRVHIWKKGKWSLSEHKAYTVNWFGKILYFGESAGVCVDKNVSFLHSPTLIKGTRVEAIFTLITETFLNRCSDPDEPFKQALLFIQSTPDMDLQTKKATEFIEENLIEYLNLLRTEALVKFDEFSEKESEQFKTEFSRATRRLVQKVMDTDLTH